MSKFDYIAPALISTARTYASILINQDQNQTGKDDRIGRIFLSACDAAERELWGPTEETPPLKSGRPND